MTTLQRRWRGVKARLTPTPEPPPLPPIDAIDLFRQATGYDPDAWQRQVLSSESKRTILNCCRQSGKSTTVAVKALHGALSTKSLTLLLSRSLRQSGELARKVFEAYQSTGRRVSADAESKLILELSNGSRIVALPGGDQASIRGFSGVHSLIIDEASQCADDLYVALRPMVAVSQGAITLLSTPYGRRGFFFRTWEQAPGWLKIEVKASQCPRLTPDFLTQEAYELGPHWYSQEYACEFIESVYSVFMMGDVLAAVSSEVQPAFPGLSFETWKKAQP
jgi:terminase large subunit-like protein